MPVTTVYYKVIAITILKIKNFLLYLKFFFSYFRAYFESFNYHYFALSSTNDTILRLS